MTLFRILIILLLPGSTFAQYTDAQIRASISQAGGPEAFIKEIARQTTGNLPVKTNSNVEIQSIAAHGKQLMYAVRLVNIEKRAVRDLEALKVSNTNYSGCGSPVLGLLIREYDARLSYNVLSKNNEFLFQYNLDKKTCFKK